MTIRIATPDDADAIERVRADTWRDAYRGLMPDRVLDGLGHDGSRRRAYMRAMDARQFVLVALHDDEIVGFVNGGPARAADTEHPGEVYAIYVLPSHQGHGHGAALMRDGARQLVDRGFGGMIIWVLRENAPSRLFYERMGGRYVRDKPERIEGTDITESAYVWDDLSVLISPRGRGR